MNINILFDATSLSIVTNTTPELGVGGHEWHPEITDVTLYIYIYVVIAALPITTAWNLQTIARNWDKIPQRVFSDSCKAPSKRLQQVVK